MDCIVIIDESLTILADLAVNRSERKIPSQIQPDLPLLQEKGFQRGEDVQSADNIARMGTKFMQPGTPSW
jgi:hypothetical protein